MHCRYGTQAAGNCKFKTAIKSFWEPFILEQLPNTFINTNTLTIRLLKGDASLTQLCKLYRLYKTKILAFGVLTI